MKQFGDVKLLWKHLNIQHRINTKSNTRIVCSQSSQDIFYSGYAYKGHLQRFHNQAEDQPQEVEPGPAGDIPVVDQPHGEQGEHEYEIAEDKPVNPKTVDEIAHEIQDATALYVATYKGETVPSVTVQRFLDKRREFVGTVVDMLESVAAQHILTDNTTAQPHCLVQGPLCL